MDPDSPGRTSLLSRRHVKKEVTDTSDGVDGTFGVASNHAKGKESKKSGMSRWLQLVIILVVVAKKFPHSEHNGACQEVWHGSAAEVEQLGPSINDSFSIRDLLKVVYSLHSLTSTIHVYDNVTI